MTSSSHRYQVIDAMRGIAVLSVIGYHYLARWAPPFNSDNVYGFPPGSTLWAVGSLGVELFFVISGLVITMTLLRCDDSIEFGIRRFARIYPAYVFSLLLVFLILQATEIPAAFEVSAKDLAANFFFGASDLGFRFVDGAHWSLVVEVKFYLFVGISYFACRSSFWIPMVGLSILGALVSMFSETAAEHLLIAPHMPLFLAGIAAWYWIFTQERGKAAMIGALACALYAFHSSHIIPEQIPSWLGHAYIVGLSATMILALKLGIRINLPPLAWVGRVSYSLYLVHQRLGIVLILALAPHLGAAAGITISLAAVLIISALMFYLIELPGQDVVIRFLDSMRERIALGKKASRRS